MQIGIKTALKSWGSNAKIICHKVQKLVEWVPRGSSKKYPYLSGDPLNCQRWQGRGRCMFFLDDVGEDEYVSCFINDGFNRWATIIKPKEGTGDKLVAGRFEMTVYNGDIIADNGTIEGIEDELRRMGENYGYSFLKDPRNLIAVYAVREGIVKKLETCLEESPEKCRIW